MGHWREVYFRWLASIDRRRFTVAPGGQAIRANLGCPALVAELAQSAMSQPVPFAWCPIIVASSPENGSENESDGRTVFK